MVFYVNRLDGNGNSVPIVVGLKILIQMMYLVLKRLFMKLVLFNSLLLRLKCSLQYLIQVINCSLF